MSDLSLGIVGLDLMRLSRGLSLVGLRLMTQRVAALRLVDRGLRNLWLTTRQLRELWLWALVLATL
ncbi:MAG: hypothetical protein ABJB47_01420 [Actinomycetota bacterium]